MTEHSDRSTRSAGPSFEDVRTTTEDTLVELIRETAGEASPVLLGLCAHPNVGDIALNVAEDQLLRRARRRPSAAPGSDRTLRADKVPRSASLIVHGGGNIGDLYPTELDLRVDALEHFPHRPMLQIPQSIHFTTLGAADRYRRAVSCATRYRLLARDQPSYDWAVRYVDCPVELVADAAVTLNRPRSAVPPHRGLLLLLRDDKEAAASRGEIPAGLTSSDWPGEVSIRDDWRVWPKWVRDGTARHRRTLPNPIDRALLMRLSTTRLQRGIELLSSARVVVTDRLHGHILSAVLGIPHVVIDNSYGKLSAFMDTWDMDARAAVMRASSIIEAVDVAHELAGSLTANDEERA